MPSGDTADFSEQRFSQASQRSSQGARNGKSKGGCCGLLGGSKASRNKAQHFDQCLVLLRHSERRDYVDKTYLQTEEGKQWPHDTPLTERGHELASEVAQELAELHEKAKFGAIACSPYRRCLETAAAVAKLLKLPLIVDQELGEIWGKEIPKEPNPFRLGKELRELINSLGVKDSNPTVEDGLKLFGKSGAWPESLEAAKTRYLVRIETYIEQSAQHSKNYILVTHADAVAAAIHMFERGNADVQAMDFCARLIAKRKVEPKDLDEDSLVYGQKWDVKTMAVTKETMEVDRKMEKYYEKQHMEVVEDEHLAAAKRKANRTKTDAVFAISLQNIDLPEDDEDEDDVEGHDSANKNNSTASSGNDAKAVDSRS